MVSSFETGAAGFLSFRDNKQTFGGEAPENRVRGKDSAAAAQDRRRFVPESACGDVQRHSFTCAL